MYKAFFELLLVGWGVPFPKQKVSCFRGLANIIMRGSKVIDLKYCSNHIVFGIKSKENLIRNILYAMYFLRKYFYKKLAMVEDYFL